MKKLSYYAVSNWNMKWYYDLIVDAYRFSEFHGDEPVEYPLIFDIKILVLEKAKLKVCDKRVKFCEDSYGR